MPKRIQRKRTKGWKMPENTVYVGRPTKWGNPYMVRAGLVSGYDLIDVDNNYKVLAKYAYRDKALRDAVRWYEQWVKNHPSLISAVKGKDLACWCPLDKPCHADVLLKLANEE